MRDEQEQRRAFARRALARNGVGEYNLSVAVSSDRASAAEERAGVCECVCVYAGECAAEVVCGESVSAGQTAKQAFYMTKTAR